MTVLTVDPGKRSLAWALWWAGNMPKSLRDVGYIGRTLRDVGYIEWKDATEFETPLHSLRLFVAARPDLVVVEVPCIYPRERVKAPNDLIDLAVVAGACATLGPLRLVRPAEWKGQTPKEICNARTRASLSAAEVKVLDGRLAGIAKSKHHHVLDAVGMGLWWRAR